MNKSCGYEILALYKLFLSKAHNFNTQDHKVVMIYANKAQKSQAAASTQKPDAAIAKTEHT